MSQANRVDSDEGGENSRAPAQSRSISQSEENREPAKVVQGTCTITLSKDELRQVGINPTDAEKVQPRILSGAILLETV
jgi:hypothetical protein